MNEVVVTGLGLLSPLGWGVDEHLDALRAGRSGLSILPQWEELGLRSRIGGVPPRERAANSQSRFTERQLLTMGVPSAQAALAAAAALGDAGLEAEPLGDASVGCVIGAGVGSMPPIVTGAKLIERGKARRVSPFSLLQSMSSSASAHLTHLFGLGGPSWTVASACASSTHAIGQAADLIRSGACDLALTGGTEELNEIVVASFEALRTALSREEDRPERAVLPFSRDRRGLALSGGAAMMVLENRERAEARGQRAYGRVLGWAANSSASDLVQPEPNGTTAAICMSLALERSGVSAEEVDYVNAHGTGTPAGDLAEARAVDRVFGDRRPWVGSTKGLTGHLLGGAGALEAAICLLALDHQLLPGMPHQLEVPFDEQLPQLHWVGDSCQPAELRTTLSNSFGFGGTNGTILFGRD